MKQRVVAVLVAVGLVVGAIIIRQAVVGGGSDGEAGPGAPAGLPRVASAPDLAAVCLRLAAERLIASGTPALGVDGAAKPPEGLDGWITWDPGPRVADYADRNDTVWEQAQPVAHGRLAVAGTEAALDDACGTESTWSCVATAPRDGATVGVGDPSSAESLARLAPIVKSTNRGDLPALTSQVRDLVDSPQLGQGDAAEMADRMVTQPGSVDLVVGPAALLAKAMGTPQGKARGIAMRIPDPLAEAMVVLATVPDAKAPSATAICRAAVAELAGAGAGSCGGTLLTEKLAGLLYQVHERVG
ncbi:MAG: hypothetical protein U0P45_13170 [Acidimicrobiales bacterium]